MSKQIVLKIKMSHNYNVAHMTRFGVGRFVVTETCFNELYWVGK
jgi:hypothetical protein